MQTCLSTVGKHNCISASSSYWIVCYMKLWSLEENLGLFTDLLSSLHLTGQCPHKSILLPAQRPLRKYCVIDPWASVPLRLKTEEYVVHFTGAVSCKIWIAVVIQTLGKKVQHVMMCGTTMMHAPQFESLANHPSGVKLITLRAVSWRQPGDIYLWTHVSNLAITVPLINSLPESLPGEQEFTDSDRLMMLVSCNSVALKLYSD